MSETHAATVLIFVVTRFPIKNFYSINHNCFIVYLSAHLRSGFKIVNWIAY